MSGTIKDYFNNAQLAQASYALLNKGLNPIEPVIKNPRLIYSGAKAIPSVI